MSYILSHLLRHWLLFSFLFFLACLIVLVSGGWCEAREEEKERQRQVKEVEDQDEALRRMLEKYPPEDLT